MYEYIEFIICYGEGITPDEVKIKTRKAEIVFARQLIMYFSMKFKVGTQGFIGNLTGGKDHATVIHSIKTINNYIETDKKKRFKIEYYEKLLGKVLDLELASKTSDIKRVLKPLEKQISDLESRCINLSLQLTFLKKQTAITP